MLTWQWHQYPNLLELKSPNELPVQRIKAGRAQECRQYFDHDTCLLLSLLINAVVIFELKD